MLGWAWQGPGWVAMAWLQAHDLPAAGVSASLSASFVHMHDASHTSSLRPWQDYRVVERTLGAQGLAAAQEGASSEEEEVATSDSSSGDEETDKKQRKREKQGEGEAAHKPGPAIKVG